MRTRRLLLRWIPLLLCGSCGSPPVPLLATDVVGCDDLRSSAAGAYVCGISQPASGALQPIRMRVRSFPGARLRIQGSEQARIEPCKPEECGEPGQVAAGTSYELTVPLGAQIPTLALTVTASSSALGPGDEPPLVLRIEPFADLPELVAAEEALKRRDTAERERLVESALTKYASDPAALARVYRIRAECEEERSIRGAGGFFQKSAELARANGLLSVAASSARRYAFQQFRGDRDRARAEQILDEYQPIISQVGVEHGYALYNRGMLAQESGHLARAAGYYEQTLVAEKRLDEPELRRSARVARAYMFAQEGLIKDSEAEIAAFLADAEGADPSWEHCERQKHFNTLGFARLLGREAQNAAAGDPIELLFRAREAAQSEPGCAIGYSAAVIEINLARAELLQVEQQGSAPTLAADAPSLAASDVLDRIDQRLRRAKELQSPLSRALRMDHAELSGRTALLKKDPKQAAEHFREMEEQARASQDPDYVWRALIGQALASAELSPTSGPDAAQHLAAAQSRFAAAEKFLDEWLWLVPLRVGRRSFAVRFMHGTALHLDFLLQRGLDKDALRVARMAQVRGLITTLAFDVLSALPEPQRSLLAEKRNEYLQQRAAMQEQPEDAAASHQALGKLEELLGALRQSGLSDSSLTPLKDGEVLFLCHPLPGDRIACFAAEGDRILPSQFSRAQLQAAQKQGPDAVSGLLLKPFAGLIDRASVLRIVPSGVLQRINFATLPWPGPVPFLASEQRAVVYSLDLVGAPPQIRSLSDKPSAMLLANLELREAAESTPDLFRRLRELGWDVSVFTNMRFDEGLNLSRTVRCWVLPSSCPSPLAIPARLSPGRRSNFLSAIPSFTLAHLFTHARYARETGWESFIKMPDGSLVSVGDLLTLSGVPRFTIMIVCEGGQASDGEADDISLAQAILLRGGEGVMTSVTELKTEIGTDWASAVYMPQPGDGANAARAPLQAAQPSLIDAHRAALNRLRASGASPEHWGAVRLFVH